jgi:hypothetical protein
MAKQKQTPAAAQTKVKRSTVLDAELPFMYATKAAEFVFGAEVGDGFVTITVPKDRFAGTPKTLLVKAEIAE